MSRVFPEGSAKAGAAGKGGGPGQYTGTGEWAGDREGEGKGVQAMAPRWGHAVSAVVAPTGFYSIQATVALLKALVCGSGNATEVSGGAGSRDARQAGSRLAGGAGRQRRASARLPVGQQVDDTARQ
jgi:hypothetical protein